MDKNNDIKVNRVSKWEAAPKDMGALFTYIDMVIGMACCLPHEIHDNLYDLMDKTLDDYNELEAKYQEACGMISQYEEENRILREQKEELTDAHDERKDAKPDNAINIGMCGPYYVLDEQIKNENTELRSQCKSKDNALKEMIKEVAELEKEKIDLEVQLAQSDDLRYRSAKYAWAIKTILKKATFSHGHIAEELIFMARKSTTPKDVQERWEEYADELLGEHSKLVDKINRLEKKNEEVKKENDNLKQTLLNILETLETKVGLYRIRLLDSYENRANLIAVEIDRLLIKYEKLKDENNNLTTDNKRLNNAVEAWFDMFNDMRHKRDLLKKEYKKLKETNKSCPVACECENFKPKVHHSYDPLDDLPDMEHS